MVKENNSIALKNLWLTVSKRSLVLFSRIQFSYRQWPRKSAARCLRTSNPLARVMEMRMGLSRASTMGNRNHMW